MTDNQPGGTMQASETRPNNTLWRHGEDLVLWINGEWRWLTGDSPHGAVDESRLERLPCRFDCVWHPEHGSHFVSNGTDRSITLSGTGPGHVISLVDWPGKWRLVDDVIREQRDEIERLRAEAARSIGSTAALKMQRKSEYDRSCHLGQQLLAIRRHVKIFHANYGEEVGDEDDRDYIVGRCQFGEKTIAAIDGIAADTDIPEDAVAMEDQATQIAEQAAEIEKLKRDLRYSEIGRMSDVQRHKARIAVMGPEIEMMRAKLEAQRSQHVARTEELIKSFGEEVTSRDDKIRDLESEIERLKTASASVETARESLDQSIVEEQAKRIRELEAKIEQLKSAHAAERERLAHDRRIDEHVIAQQAREIWGGGE